MSTIYPMVLVFYMSRETDPVIINHFRDSVNMVLDEKGENVIAFFLPTDGEDRLECINPINQSEEQMLEVNSMITDIKNSFNI